MWPYPAVKLPAAWTHASTHSLRPGIFPWRPPLAALPRQAFGFGLRKRSIHGGQPLLGSHHQMTGGKLGNDRLKSRFGVIEVPSSLLVNPPLEIIIRSLFQRRDLLLQRFNFLLELQAVRFFGGKYGRRSRQLTISRATCPKSAIRTIATPMMMK